MGAIQDLFAKGLVRGFYACSLHCGMIVALGKFVALGIFVAIAVYVGVVLTDICRVYLALLCEKQKSETRGNTAVRDVP
jgi:hypothetical protein